jgi:hypothetical protein
MRRLVFFVVAALACGAVVKCNAAPAVDGLGDLRLSVRTVDGRTLEGAMDARTDDRSLWVRRAEGGVVLATAVAWRDVDAATLGGETVEAFELRARRAELASEGSASEPGASLGLRVLAPTTETPVVRPPQVRNLELVNACVVNFDRDVEPDGLEVSIATIGDDGAAIAVAGSLRLQLLGERRPARVSLVEFGELDSWTQPVAPMDFVDGVATYELPFRRSAPEWQFDLLPDAILTAQLGVFGHGNYAASTPVTVRPLNPVRDNLQLLEETRFLPGELQGRRTRNRLAPENGLWLHWTR